MKLAIKNSAAGIISMIWLCGCSLTEPIAATSNPTGDKVGVSSGTCYFGICLNVDASINSAVKKGNIKSITTVDYRTTNYLGIIKKYECIVTGN